MSTEKEAYVKEEQEKGITFLCESNAFGVEKLSSVRLEPQPGLHECVWGGSTGEPAAATAPFDMAIIVDSPLGCLIDVLLALAY
ncbi:hypothetical protein RJT34_23256 [Clitoria ternatea]|uniref:Uncharacterized protein n=1 Tax=Clitoria ternatea TaxID=43366 RepID=A0AAN9II89_CLITE